MGKKFNNRMIQLEYSKKTRGVFSVFKYIGGIVKFILVDIAYNLVFEFIGGFFR